MTLEHPFADLVGFSVSERTEKQCVTELTLEKKHLNPNGVVHGGVLYTLADTGMGGALMEPPPRATTAPPSRSKSPTFARLRKGPCAASRSWCTLGAAPRASKAA